jgi:anti-sigma-K factor RskA
VSLSGRPGVLAKVLTTGSGTVFVATGMEDPPSDRTYQLWLFEEGSPVSAGTFDPSEGVAIVRTSRSSESIEGAAVTVEPRGGSRSPTTQPVMQSG